MRVADLNARQNASHQTLGPSGLASLWIVWLANAKSLCRSRGINPPDAQFNLLTSQLTWIIMVSNTKTLGTYNPEDSPDG